MLCVQLLPGRVFLLTAILKVGTAFTSQCKLQILVAKTAADRLSGSWQAHADRDASVRPAEVVNKCAFGYLSQRIVFYLLNLHIKTRQTYFCRAGTTKDEDIIK